VADDFKSPIRKLLQSCRKSRDKWKKKSQKNLARLKNAENKRIYHQGKSKEQRQKIKTLESELSMLRSQLEASKKKN